MRPTQTKTLSIMLCMLVVATTVVSVVDATISVDERENNLLSNSSIKHSMIGFILLDYEYIVDTLFIYGFRAIAVLCITYENEEPVDVRLLGPSNYISLSDYRCDGFLSYFVIWGTLTSN